MTNKNKVKETHTHSWTPYNGNNPNNCSHCGESSSNWAFTPLDVFDTKHLLCNGCISKGALYKLGIKNKDVDSLTQFNH